MGQVGAECTGRVCVWGGGGQGCGVYWGPGGQVKALLQPGF